MLRGHSILFFKPFAGLARRSVPVAARVAIQAAKVIVYWSCLELSLFVQCPTSTFGPAKSSKHWRFMKQNFIFSISFASFNLNYMLKKMNFVAWCFFALENLICFESAHVACWAISKQIRFSSISKYHALKFIFFEQNSSNIMKLLNCKPAQTSSYLRFCFMKRAKHKNLLDGLWLLLRFWHDNLRLHFNLWYLPCASTNFVKWQGSNHYRNLIKQFC